MTLSTTNFYQQNAPHRFEPSKKKKKQQQRSNFAHSHQTVPNYLASPTRGDRTPSPFPLLESADVEGFALSAIRASAGLLRPKRATRARCRVRLANSASASPAPAPSPSLRAKPSRRGVGHHERRRQGQARRQAQREAQRQPQNEGDDCRAKRNVGHGRAYVVHVSATGAEDTCSLSCGLQRTREGSLNRQNGCSALRGRFRICRLFGVPVPDCAVFHSQLDVLWKKKACRHLFCGVIGSFFFIVGGR